MKKIVLLLSILLGIFSSCKKENEEEPVVFDEYYIVNESNSYIYIYGTETTYMNEYGVSGFFGNSTMTMYSGYDYPIFKGEFMLLENDDLVLNSKIGWGKNSNGGILDSTILVKSYIIHLDNVKDIRKEENPNSIYRQHYYVFTDSLIQNIQDSMLVKGIKPEKYAN